MRRVLRQFALALALLPGFAVAKPAPRLALMIAGIGYAETPSLNAVGLPAAVTLALSPYGDHLRMISQMAQSAGHELIMALPMTPRAAPPSNEGPEALAPDDPPAQNLQRLEWALGQAAGYDGVTNAIGDGEGGAFMRSEAARNWLAQELGHRHLFFVSSLAGPAERIRPGRAATIMIDPDLGPDATKRALAALERDARSAGSALGVIANPAPVTLALLEPWLQHLSGSGIALVPVRDLVRAP